VPASARIALPLVKLPHYLIREARSSSRAQPFVLVQIAEPSRTRLPKYRKARSRVVETAARVNRRFGSREYRPLIVLERHVDSAEVFSCLRAADVCYVGSLHDGMNLVAKEFVSARDDESGVLMLSEFTGAAHELTTALRVNPYAIDECATTLANALSMPREQQRTRMQAMRAIVAHSNSYRWAADMLADAFHRRMQPASFQDIDFGRSRSPRTCLSPRALLALDMNTASGAAVHQPNEIPPSSGHRHLARHRRPATARFDADAGVQVVAA